MPITTLDPRTALVVVDLQKGIVAMPTAHPAAATVALSATLAAAFRARGRPVVLVNVTGGAPGRTDRKMSLADLPPDWTEIVPALDPQPADLRITKKTYGAFTNTGLEAKLHALGVTQIVLCGVATSIGVESTARFAHELGFNVTFAVDAMTDLSLEAHENSITRIFPRLGEAGTSAEIIALLERS